MSMFSLNLWPKQPSDHARVELLPESSVMRILWTIYAVFEYFVQHAYVLLSQRSLWSLASLTVIDRSVCIDIFIRFSLCQLIHDRYAKKSSIILFLYCSLVSID